MQLLAKVIPLLKNQSPSSLSLSLSIYYSKHLYIFVFEKYGATEEEIFNLKNSKNLEDVVFDVASLAKDHLDLSRSLSAHVPKHATHIFYPAFVCQVILERLEKANFDIFHPSLDPKVLKLPIIWNMAKSFNWTHSY